MSTTAPKDNDEVEIAIHPEVPQARNTTDVPFLLVFLTSLFLLIPLGIVFAMGSDINRFFYGSDRHGNICGIKNAPIYGINCSGQDMTLKPIAMLKYYPVKRCFRNSERKILPDRCVDICNPPNELIFHRCYPSEDVNLDSGSRFFKQMTQIFDILSESTYTILVMSLTGLVLSIVMFLSLRLNHLIVTFWALVIFQLTASVMVTAVFWHKYVLGDYQSTLDLFISFGAIMYFIFVLAYVTLLHNTIMVTIHFYEEALEAIFKMPLLLIHSFLVISAAMILTAFLAFIIFLICSNGCLQQSEDLFTLEYTTNITALIFACILIFLTMWIFAFFEGCQSMIIASSVNLYTSSRDKSALQEPLKKSYKTMTHHLGTIACGSLIVSLFSCIRGLVEYTVRKIYIQTALHGYTFAKSSSQVIKLLSSNLVPTITITGFNYILTSGFSLLVMSLTVCMGLWLNLENMSKHCAHVAIFFGALITSIVAVFVIQVLNVATDAVFLRFCEENIIPKNAYSNPLIINATVMRIIQRAKAFKKNVFNVY